MAKLQNYNGRFCESEFENAFLAYLEAEDWQYLAGSSMARRSKRDVLYEDDLEQFLSKTNPDLTADEVRQIMDTVRLAGAESDFAFRACLRNENYNCLRIPFRKNFCQKLSFDIPEQSRFLHHEL